MYIYWMCMILCSFYQNKGLDTRTKKLHVKFCPSYLAYLLYMNKHWTCNISFSTRSGGVPILVGKSYHRRNQRAWLAMAQISVLMDARSAHSVAVRLSHNKDTLAQSHLPKTSCVSGAAAEDASLRKIAKYTGVRQRYDFVAIAVETLGPMNEDGVNFLLGIGRRLSSISGDHRENSFLLQKVSVTLQRYNAIVFRGSFNLIGGFRIAGWGLEESGLLGTNLWISRERSTWGKKIIAISSSFTIYCDRNNITL